MSLTLISPPAGEPVSLAELKSHLRVDTTTDDTLITGLGVAARQAIEARFGLAVMAQGWRLNLTGPRPACVELPIAPVISVDAVTEPDGAGGSVAIDTAAYETDVGRIGFVRFEGAAGAGELSIDFTAGFADAASVPEEIKLAIKALAAHFYEHREEAGTDRFYTSPQSLNALLAHWRRVRV